MWFVTKVMLFFSVALFLAAVIGLGVSASQIETFAINTQPFWLPPEEKLPSFNPSGTYEIVFFISIATMFFSLLGMIWFGSYYASTPKEVQDRPITMETSKKGSHFAMSMGIGFFVVFIIVVWIVAGATTKSTATCTLNGEVVQCGAKNTDTGTTKKCFLDGHEIPCNTCWKNGVQIPCEGGGLDPIDPINPI
jgi:hypothetical protein